MDLDVCTTNYRTSKCMQQNLMELKVATDKSSLRVSKFSSTFQQIDRQKDKVEHEPKSDPMLGQNAINSKQHEH